MIEFLTEMDKAKQTGRWAQFKAATSGSKGEVKKRMQRKGGFWGVFAGLIASATASGELRKHNKSLEDHKLRMERAAVNTIHSLNVLKDVIELERPRDEVMKAAKRLKLDNMEMKKYATEMIRVVDEYKRVHDEDKKAGAFRFNVKEYDRHDFREIYHHLNMIEDSTFYVDKAASSAMTGDTEYAIRMIRNITNAATR
ncbi:hypothetical protein phiST2_0235 [Vibrio phage phi-ST2]|nr:hypothetical protein phiST2_0235 [Vibrio phage phi-ST2]QBX06102.1 hypothetical protein Va3_148 [Vibrio phage Va3]QNJ54727.1 hypothetical protein vBValMR10Z_187 [Vibrio phage vB_ValM_R10Z]QNJ55114.1 hypothetical protein vBValMR11Z_188 [Vibrio phage vB_ValM_R11Z]